MFPAVAPVNSTNTTQSGVADTLTIIFEQDNGTHADLTVAAPPTKRWGQTATYLSSHNVVLVVGGQTSLAGDITNDVYALDVADMSAASMVSNSTAQSWRRLSSDGLPAHAYAAATTMVDPLDGMEKLWIVGGVTQNCAVDAPAYVWSAPLGNVSAGTWTAVYSDDGVSPQRRRGAKAVTLPSSNATSMMVAGGSFDASTCADNNGTYAGVDMWRPSPPSPAPTSTANMGIDTTGVAFASIKSLALDPRIDDLPLTDYTTAVLPATPTCSQKILFLGGRTSSSLAPLSRFWVLDVTSGNFELWNATGLIPAGRLGHTAVVTPDGKVIIHGGYLQDPTVFKTDNDPISEVFVLDPTRSPARWDAAVWTKESTRPPAVAWHSATMAGSVMVVSFGKAGMSGVGEGQSFLKGDGAGQVHYLDTATMQNGGGLTWSTSTQGVQQARQALADASAAASIVSSPPAPVSAAPTVETPTTAPPAAASPSIESQAAPSPSAPSPLPTDTDSPPPTNDSQTTPPSTNSNHTGVIAGTLLGAAALAAALGGIYAYRKRKEAAAYNEGRLDGSCDEEKGARGPYVSSLNLRAEDLRAVPTASAGAVAGGWGARLKRAASSLTRSNGAAEPVRDMRNTPPRPQDLPDEFITSLLDDIPLGRADLIHPTPAHEVKLTPSNLSLASVSTLHASHFSYPYLSGMHRHTSPQEEWQRWVPGDVVSPYQLPYNPHASPESVFLDETDTNVAADGGEATPIFPWQTPDVALPEKARAKESGLRVTNLC